VIGAVAFGVGYRVWAGRSRRSSGEPGQAGQPTVADAADA
jgi:hypothetical protein